MAVDKTVSGKTALTGAVGGVSGVGLAPLIIWLFGQFNVEMPPEEAALIGGLITAAGTFLVGWLKPARQGKYVVDPDGPDH